jgi:hypothetical protein
VPGSASGFSIANLHCDRCTNGRLLIQIQEARTGLDSPLDKSSIIPYKWVMISSILHLGLTITFILGVIMLRWPRMRVPIVLLFAIILLSYK